MGFTCGIVGLPNVGKSTLFNGLTSASIEAKNFPFCTIEPNTGVVPVPDPRLKIIGKIIKTKRIVPTTIKFVDIAGLIKGSYKGEGLGNQFLRNIRETEAICHVVRCFENEKIIHVYGKVNPVEDIDVINTELSLFDLDTCALAFHRLQKKYNSGSKEAKYELSILKKCMIHIKITGMLIFLDLQYEEKNVIKYINFLTLKKIMYIANVDEYGLEKNPYLDQVREISASQGLVVVVICAKIEYNFYKKNYEYSSSFFYEKNIKQHGLKKLIHAGYHLLNLTTYFTAGLKELRAWTIPFGAHAIEAARKIHTDIAKGFILAKTVSFYDCITYNGIQKAKEFGKMRSEGKDYIVQDGDVIQFLFNI